MFFEYLIDIIKINLGRSFDIPIKPRFINFLLTYRCNARCAMCNIWDTYNQNPSLMKEELTREEIEKFFVENIDFLSELRNLGLSGGEPLLMRNDFVEIVRMIRHCLPRVRVGVQTNGLIPELAQQRLKEIVSFCPDFSIAVSLDAIGDIHTQMRGVEDAFVKATQTIRFAQQLGINNITSGMTITRYNYKEIREVKKFAESLGVEFSCFPPEVSDYFNNQSLDCFNLNAEDWSNVVKQLKECCGYHYYMDNLRLQLQKKRRRHLPCFSGFTSLIIDPYGNVKPCVLNVKGADNDIFGNIKNRSLKDILTTPHTKRIKAKIKQCSCWCQCEVSSSVIVYPFDILTWFVFYCSDRKGFLRHVFYKKEKYYSLL